MKEERLQILRMVQEGAITAEQGAKLLAALGSDSPAAETAVPANRGFSARWLRIRVVEKSTGRARANVTLPIGLLDLGLRFAEKAAGYNLSAVRDAIHGGAEGKILEVDESETDERVEIFVE